MQNNLLNDISLRPLCKADLKELAQSLRAQDRAELWAMYRLPALAALEVCLRRSALAWALVRKGKAIAAAGAAVQSLLGNSACVWAWTGYEVWHCRKAYWRASQEVLARLFRHYGVLYSVCDERYAVAQRYLLRLGAKAEGESFYLSGRETRFRLYRFQRRPQK